VRLRDEPGGLEQGLAVGNGDNGRACAVPNGEPRGLGVQRNGDDGPGGMCNM
jgi:hypothetical protein